MARGCCSGARSALASAGGCARRPAGPSWRRVVDAVWAGGRAGVALWLLGCVMTAVSLQAEADAAMASFGFARAAELYHRVLAERETDSARAGLEKSRRMLRKELDILHIAQSKAMVRSTPVMSTAVCTHVDAVSSVPSHIAEDTASSCSSSFS